MRYEAGRCLNEAGDSYVLAGRRAAYKGSRRGVR